MNENSEDTAESTTKPCVVCGTTGDSVKRRMLPYRCAGTGVNSVPLCNDCCNETDTERTMNATVAVRRILDASDDRELTVPEVQSLLGCTRQEAYYYHKKSRMEDGGVEREGINGRKLAR